ncbi:MAG: hypothetical protein KJ626_09500 [Verrucomicrobia bacterium]|nr:hypothetical protein [Verrucomicrobiota bacterium]
MRSGPATHWSICCGLLAAFIMLPALVSFADTDPSAEFAMAATAYDKADFPEAAQAYHHLLESGYETKEVFYNLGNVLFRSDRVGEAVWAYRNAWHFAPRDPDILANMRFAQNVAGVPETKLSVYQAVSTHFSLSRWVQIGTAAYWLSAILLCIIFLFPMNSRLLVRFAGLSALVLLVCVLASAYWISLRTSPEHIVTKANVKAMYGPFAESTAFFNLPEGSVVAIEETAHDWVKVRSGTRSGWIERSAIRTVSPWKEPSGAYTVSSLKE